MTRKNILISLIALAAITTSGYAGGDISPVVLPVPVDEQNEPSPFYVGAGLIWGEYSGCPRGDGCKYEDVTYGAMARAGYDWNQYIGIEARYLKTFWDEDSLGGQKLEHFGIFAKPMYPISEDFTVYGLAGYGWTETSTGGNKLLPTVNDNGFSAGVGIEYDLSDRDGDREENMQYDREFDGYADQGRGWSLFLDYQRLLIDSDVPDMDVISVGVRYDF